VPYLVAFFSLPPDKNAILFPPFPFPHLFPVACFSLLLWAVCLVLGYIQCRGRGRELEEGQAWGGALARHTSPGVSKVVSRSTPPKSNRVLACIPRLSVSSFDSKLEVCNVSRNMLFPPCVVYGALCCHEAVQVFFKDNVRCAIGVRCVLACVWYVNVVEQVRPAFIIWLMDCLPCKPTMLP